MATRIQVRRGTNTQWNTTDPILNEGEFGYSTTDSQFKIGDGSTIWSELDYVPSAASLGSSLGDYIELIEKGAIDGVAELDGSRNILAPAGIIFEGTENAHETTLTVTDPTADRTITFPDVTGTVITTGNLSDITNIGVFSSTITMEGSTANDFELTLSAGDPTADRTITFPDATGTVALTTDIAVTESSTTTFTNKTLTSPKINEDVIMSATATELNILDGATLSTTELNYVDGVTSSIQTQMDLKAPAASPTFTGTVVLPSTVNGPNTTTSVNLLSTSTSANITLGAQQTSGNLTIGGGTQRTTGIVGIGTGATTSGTKTINLGTGSTGGTTEIVIGSSSGATSNITLNGTVTAANNLVITGDLTVNGTTTTINSTTLAVDDKNIVLADGNTSDASADGGGITLSGATSKTFNWVDATDAWTSSEHMNLASAKSYKINNTAISAALPALTWGEVKNGKSGLVIS
jgi:hypothetical protein